MKKSVGELSITVITISAITLLSAMMLQFVLTGQNYILKTFNTLFNNAIESNNNDTNDTVYYPKINTNSTTINNTNKQEIKKELDNGTKLDSSFKINETVKSKLKNKTEKNIKNKNNNLDYTYYKLKSNYIVNVTNKDNNTNAYYMYKTQKNIFNQENYKLVNTINTNSSESKKKNQNLIDSEKKSSFSIDENYGDSFISKAAIESNKHISDKTIEEIYKKNINNIVTLNTYQNDVLEISATGFLIKDGIIATSWNYIEKSLKKGNNIVALTTSDMSYQILGIIAMNQEADIAILKLETQVSSNIKFGNIKPKEEIALLGSFSGFGISGRIGVNLNNDSFQTNNLIINETNIGSPLFNNNGECIGMVVSNSINKELSNSVSSEFLKKYISKYEKINFNNINYYTLNDLSIKYYKYKIKTQQIEFSILKTTWDKYKKIGNIETSIPLKPIKTNNYNNIVSIKYLNDTNIENDLILTSFISNLKKDNYKEIVNTNKKKIYKSKEFNITIFYELNYIIITIEEV